MQPQVAICEASVDAISRRGGERRRVKLRALVREAGSARVDIDVVDLSAGGFRFQSFHTFSTGTRVFLSVPTLQALEALVVWRATNDYGCQFVRPIHAAVFETIAARFS